MNTLSKKPFLYVYGVGTYSANSVTNICGFKQKKLDDAIFVSYEVLVLTVLGTRLP